MIGLIILFIVSLIILWLFIMYSLWKKDDLERKYLESNINRFSYKTAQVSRKIYFLLTRKIDILRSKITLYLAKAFFFFFPKAKKAFEKKDALTGIEQGPSSYFLMSISKEVTENSKPQNEPKKTRRKIKNV